MVVEKETLRKIISEEVEAKMRWLFREIGFSSQVMRPGGNDPEWLNIEEAKRIVPYKSRRSWKLLRDHGKIDFAKVGKGFIYNKQSLVDYIYANSTITQVKRHGKRLK